jgi:hypothetical protein
MLEPPSSLLVFSETRCADDARETVNEWCNDAWSRTTVGSAVSAPTMATSCPPAAIGYTLGARGSFVGNPTNGSRASPLAAQPLPLLLSFSHGDSEVRGERDESRLEPSPRTRSYAPF